MNTIIGAVGVVVVAPSTSSRVSYIYIGALALFLVVMLAQARMDLRMLLVKYPSINIIYLTFYNN